MFKKIPIDLRSVDQEWLCAWLVESSSLSAQALTDIMQKDSEAALQLLEYFTSLGLGLRLGKAFQSKVLTAIVLDRRIKMVGDRLVTFKWPFLKCPRGHGINWKEVGVYYVEFSAQGICTKILHRPTGDETAPMAHTVVTQDFALVGNWSDWGARLLLAPADYHIHQFFGENKGPRKHKQWSGSSKEFADLVAECKDHADKAVQEPNSAVVEAASSSVGQQIKNSKRQASMVKAREALIKQKEQVKKQRVICLK